MEHSVESINEKILAGKRLKMSLAENKTQELWHEFMSEKKEIRNNIGSALYSMQIYDPLYFDHFDPGREFEKWAAIEVTDSDTVPDTMETIKLPAGLYAVFSHKGGAKTGPDIFRYIFGTWLPAADYTLDNRPHFEILGDKYKNEDPESEEEIWIPIKPKDEAT
jgi:AraC family transcriptional regulator